ncbi:MAG TPA: sialidase family protein, partial [Candidatus Thermoplasmatota archaeon]|nr:sialidase family protein [Candidatus Thermoplasmatota archaeon]
FVLMASVLMLAGCAAPPPVSPPGPEPPAPLPSTAVNLTFLPPVDLHAIGYEPSIAVDQTGAIYWTAHKDLTKPETWPYPASWFQVSRDNGATWEDPASPTPVLNLPQQFVGDEGDIAVDARGWVYFVDTYLADNHIHVWSDQGRTWQMSQPIQKTTGADDRPWVSAQGDGIVHYLGNNGVVAQDGTRHWYYRSTDAGLTWSPQVFVPGTGWATMDAERAGTNLYIATEAVANGPSDMLVVASHDSGATWEQPVVVGHRDGESRAYPVVSAAPEGVVWVVWPVCGSAENCADSGGMEPVNLTLARSLDAGATWTSWNLTVPGYYVDYPTITAGPNGTVAIAFYAAATPVNESSAWGLYAAMARAPGNRTPDFTFRLAAPEVVYEGRDLHALHDFFEIAIGPDETLHIGYMHAEDSTDPEVPVAGGRAPQDYGERTVWYVQGRGS